MRSFHALKSRVGASSARSALAGGTLYPRELARLYGLEAIVQRGQELSVWGTSASAPIAGAIAALVHQASGHLLTHADLYARAADVAAGNDWNDELLRFMLDTFYAAGTGYDLCTGMGTPVATSSLAAAPAGTAARARGSFAGDGSSESTNPAALGGTAAEGKGKRGGAGDGFSRERIAASSEVPHQGGRPRKRRGRSPGAGCLAGTPLPRRMLPRLV